MATAEFSKFAGIFGKPNIDIYCFMYVSISVYISVGTSEFPSSSPDASWWFLYFFSAKLTSNEDSD